MTGRKPSGASWENWIDRQIREAADRGDFENLPGTGEPLPDPAAGFDDSWWIKQKLRREGLTYMSASLALRKEAREALEAASRASSETEVRQIIGAINEQIREANRKGVSGPEIMLVPFDVEGVVREWRERETPGRG